MIWKIRLPYQPPDGGIVIEVTIEDETIWLSQAQMTELFETTKQKEMTV